MLSTSLTPRTLGLVLAVLVTTAAGLVVIGVAAEAHRLDPAHPTALEAFLDSPVSLVVLVIGAFAAAVIARRWPTRVVGVLAIVYSAVFGVVDVLEAATKFAIGATGFAVLALVVLAVRLVTVWFAVLLIRRA